MDENIQRELFFWKAESYSGLEEYDRAAWSYLKSAQLADQSQADLWAQSARFKAAGALVKADLYNDAQAIYTRLLRATNSASRKSVIKQELQQIRLLRNAEKNKSDDSWKRRNQNAFCKNGSDVWVRSAGVGGFIFSGKIITARIKAS